MSFGDASRVNSNIQSMQALQSLQKNQAKTSMHQMRLATGSRLNRAEDDTAGYTIASKLQSKVRGQAQALSNIGDAKSMLTVGEGALGSVMDILQTMKEKAVQAANDTMGTDERAAIESQLKELRTEISNTLDAAEFNGTSLFDGNGGAARDLSFQVGAESTDTFGVSVNKLDTTELGIADGSGAASVSTDESSWAANSTSGDKAVINAGAGTYSGPANTFTLEVTARDATDGAETVTFSVTDQNGVTDEYTYAADASEDAAMDTSGEGMLKGLAISFLNAEGDNLNSAAAAEDYFEVGASFDISVTSGGSGVEVDDASTAATTISNIDTAISKVSDSMSDIGNAQSRLSFKSENLQTSMTNYESARSRIADADFAKEQMEIVKLQILQQTGTASVAQANSAPQSVLSLF